MSAALLACIVVRVLLEPTSWIPCYNAIIAFLPSFVHVGDHLARDQCPVRQGTLRSEAWMLLMMIRDSSLQGDEVYL